MDTNISPANVITVDLAVLNNEITISNINTVSSSTFGTAFLAGPAGPANNLEIGSVTTGAPGSLASASVTGDAPNQYLNLTIPQTALADATSSTKGAVQLAGELAGPNSTAAAPTIKNLDRVYNILDYGAPIDGTSTTTAALNAAIVAASAAGGGTVTGPSGISYYFATPATMLSNVQLRFRKARFYSAVTVGGGQGILNINNKNDMIIDGITFDAGGNIMGLTSFGHSRLVIKNCDFTGTTTTPNGGVLQFDGTSSNGSTTGFFNTKIQDCRFYDITTLNARTFNVRARDGHHCEDLQVLNCSFNNVGGPAISFNTIGPAPSPGVTPIPATVGFVRRTLVDGCSAYNLREGNVTGDITSASLVNAGSSAVNTIFDLKVTNCDFYNDLTGTGAGGLVWGYGIYGLVISNNTAKGAFLPQGGGGAQGPFVSLGRVSTPCVGVVITGNKIEGFNSACDTDSMVNVEISNNIVTRCGNPFYLGYQVQRYVNIHDNVFHNSIDYDPIQTEGFRFSSSPQPIKCAVYNNLIIDDRSIPTPTGVTATAQTGGSLLASTTYYYKVTALDGVGETVGSTEVSATTDATKKQVNVTYNAVQGAVQYKLYRSTTAGSYGSTSLAGTFYYHRGGAPSNSGIVDTGATLTTGTPPATSTVMAAKMTIGLKVFGGGDFSDVSFRSNRFYLPNSTFSGGIFVKEFGTEIAPDMIDNQFTDSTGTTYDNRSERQSNKGVANGYAPLDGTGKVPSANLPAAAGSFVDLTTAQTIAGDKTFVGATTKNTPVGSNLVPLTVIQSDTTNNPNALNLTNNTTGRGINITKTSNNYALAITNTGAQDSIYTTQNTTLLTGARIATIQSSASQTNPSTAGLFVQLTNAGTTRPSIWAINSGSGKALLAQGGISTDALQIGTSSTSGFVLVTDGLGNGTYQQLTQAQVLNLVTDLATKAPLASPTFTGTVTVPTPVNSTDAATKSYVDTAVTGLLDFKGSTNASSNPNYPAALKGDSYVVSNAGKIGGAAGKSVDIGDVYFAAADNAGGDEATVGTSWVVLEHNLVGALLAANNLSDISNAATARTNLGLGTLATQNGTFSGSSSGTNTGDQTITLTGGVTGSGTGSFTATVITNANLVGDITSVGNTTSYAGIVPITNGGTGSASKNFVDLTTAQTIAGNKSLSGATNLTAALASNVVPLTVVQNDTTNNPNAVSVTSTTTGRAVDINQSGANYALAVQSTATAVGAMLIQQNTALATGQRLLTLQSNAAITTANSAGILAQLTNASATVPTIWAINSGTGNALQTSGATGKVMINGTSIANSTLQVAGSFATAITSKTASYTLTATDATITGDATSAAFSLTLPTAVGITGRQYIIKKIDASANAVTVATTSSQTIDGNTTYPLTTRWKYVSVQSDGSNWIVIANN